MKRIIFLLTFLINGTFIYGQFNTDLIIPNFSIGTGLNEMNDINVAFGYGYDFGYDFLDVPFGISAFYNRSRYGNVKERLPMYREEYGTEIVNVSNISRVTTYGLKLRYIPYPKTVKRFLPYAEAGLGFATHTSLWESKGDESYNYSNDPNCPKYRYRFSEKGTINRDNTVIGLLEIGVNIRLGTLFDGIVDDLFYHKNHRESFRKGWYISLSMRYEHGGKVFYNHPKMYKHEFYYDSGLTTASNAPYSDLKPIDLIREPRVANRHQMLFFQVGIAKTIF